MKRVTICTLAFSALMITGACTRTETSRSTPEAKSAAAADRAMVRFVNADPSKQVVDLWFGDTKAFSGVAYKSVTPYTELPADRSSFKLRGSGETTDLASNNEGLYAGRHYTIVAIKNKDNSQTLRVISDNLEAPTAGKAKVRVFNAAPNAGDVDMVAARDPKDEIFDGVDFASSTGFKEVEPGPLSVRPDDQKAKRMRLPDVNVEADKFYTVIVTGDEDAIRIEDQLGRQTAAR